MDVHVPPEAEGSHPTLRAQVSLTVASDTFKQRVNSKYTLYCLKAATSLCKIRARMQEVILQ